MNLTRLASRSLRGIVFAAAVLTGLIVMTMIANDPPLRQLEMSALVTAAYLLTAMASGTVMFARNDRSAPLGFMLGLQIGFFDLQRKTALASGLADLASGAQNVLATGGALAVLSGCFAAAWLRFGHRLQS